MHKIYLLFLLFWFEAGLAQNQDHIELKNARFATGNQDNRKDFLFDDSSWKTLRTNEVWQNQGFPDDHGYAWYRIHVKIPSALKQNAVWKDSLRFYLAHINDVDETYFNGEKIGKTGSFPEDNNGYESKWPAVRNYCIAANNPIIKWDADNVIAIKVYDGGGTGGLFMGEPYIDMLEKIDGIVVNSAATRFITAAKAEKKLLLENKFNTTVTGDFRYKITDAAQKKVIKEAYIRFTLKPFTHQNITVSFPQREGIEMEYTVTEAGSGKSKTSTEIAPYLLTPPETRKPVINSPAIIGVTAGHPVLYKIAVSGARPVKMMLKGLPAGLTFDLQTGIISGTIPANGSYPMVISAANKFGQNQQKIIFKAGSGLALTPPMGWNSWNCWGLNVSAEKVKSSADAMVAKGLANYGWNYINVDDGWQAAARAKNGEILASNKFPDMPELGKYLHQRGLKFGIYSSPGAKTCGGFLGSLGHEQQDAQTYYNWQVDYLKYDLCSYADNIAGDTSLYAQQKPYFLMRDELKKQPRDIVYSLCQYGLQDVWKWGAAANGNLWRTTEDITDTWESLYNIGFKQDKLYPFAHPGGWNDPDMLIVGRVGWGENLHPTRLTPHEQYTHISLWSLLAAPLLIGCDMQNLDDFTLNLLKNKELLAIDQDMLGKQAQKIIDKNSMQVWVKPLADGNVAVGIFNLNDQYKNYNLELKSIGIKTASTVRNVWLQKNIGQQLTNCAFNIPPHGVRLLKISWN